MSIKLRCLIIITIILITIILLVTIACLKVANKADKCEQKLKEDL